MSGAGSVTTGRAPRALVVGGGISGTSAAIALAGAGYAVRIVEREPVWSALGSGISLIGPALRALDRLGVLERCLHAGAGVQEIVVCGLDSTVISTVTLPSLLGPGTPGMLGMMRPDLHSILADAALAAHAEVSLGQTVETLEDDGDAVEVRLSDGTRERYALVVAADGLRSQLRTLCFGELEPTFRGQAVFRAVMPRPASVSQSHQFHGHTTVHAGFTPTASDKCYMYCLRAALDATRPPQAELPGLMRELLADFSGLAAEMRDEIGGPETVDYRVLETLVLPEPWNLGRVVVIGDAAHVTTPQLAAGAAMCLEDAVALGEELAGGTPVPAALERFTHRRADRCRFIVEASVALSEEQMAPATDGAVHGELMARAMRRLAEEF